MTAAIETDKGPCSVEMLPCPVISSGARSAESRNLNNRLGKAGKNIAQDCMQISPRASWSR